MASIQEILESMRPDFQKINALISNVIETTSALAADMRESSRELKEIHNSFELLIKEMDSEEVEMENGNAKVELQSESGHATDAESSYLVDSEECSEKVLILKNHSVSNSHHSPFLRHRSDRTLDSRNTWVQCRKFKNDQLCVCQRKPHVICHIRTWDEGTIKIWHPGDSAIFIRSVGICKAALTGIWDPGGIILENLTASWGEKARKCGEATSTPTVRSFDKESEPLVGMGNTKGNDGLKPWCNSKRQIRDSCSSKVVKYSRFEVAEMGSRTKKDATRIKVYRLNDDGKWDDQGTGHVTVDYLERSEELCLFIIDEEDHETLLIHHISSVDIYWNQEDTIISWRDPEYSTELALSFQEPAECSYIWDQIGSVQRNLNFNTLSNDSDHSVSSELRELPAVELSTLPLILKTVVESGIAAQMRITKLILHDQDLFRKLMEVFRVCEDLENVDGLHVIFKMVGGIILLNSPQIFEKIFGDEFIMDIIGSLEYDPDIPHVQHHRCFLKEHVVFKEALPIKDPVVLSKIHQTYRVGYLKDVNLPRALDDAIIANLNSIIHSNNAIVVSLLKDDSTFIQELFARLRSSTTHMESKINLVLFLHEFCSLSKSLQMVRQHWLYRDLVNEGKFGIIGDVLQNHDKKLVLIGTDILILFLNQDPNLSRSYVTRQEGISLFGLLVKGSRRKTIIEIFYEKHLDQLIEVITSSCSPTSVGQSVRESTDSNGSTVMIPTKPEILLNICELLCFCVLRHSYRIKCNFLLNNVIHKVLSLTRRREKYLVVAAVRFLRTLISRSNEHLMNHIARNNLLKPIVYCVLQNIVGSE